MLVGRRPGTVPLDAVTVHCRAVRLEHLPGRPGGDEVRVLEILLGVLVPIAIAGVGWYVVSSFRLQARLRILELRVEAYRKLFEVTEIASPTRLGRGELLSEEDQKALGRALYDWYYDNGNGLLMPNRTRHHLFVLQRSLQREPIETANVDPHIEATSQLRSMLRQDIGVFADEEFGSAAGWRRTRRSSIGRRRSK